MINYNVFFAFLLFIFIGQTSIVAQNASEALRYSSLTVGGTARTVGVGGGIGALGADFSVISTNPAGLATFRRSQFTFTPSFSFNDSKAQLIDENGSGITNNEISETRANFNINNVGVVFSRRPRNPNWKTFNIGLGINRIADFNQTFYYEGRSNSSFLDYFQESADGKALDNLNNFEEGLAWDVGAIFGPDDNLLYGTDVDNLDVSTQFLKNQRVERKGGINELALAFGGNYKEKLMWGLTLGFPILSFTENRTYNEDNVDRPSDVYQGIPIYRDLRYIQNLTTTGAGVNLKLGAIFRLNQMTRFGIAVHTPTTYVVSDDYQTSMLYDFASEDNDGAIEGSYQEDGFDYNISTPWRFIGSAGFVIRKAGFITAEVEYVDYGAAKFDLTENDNSQATRVFEEELNREIDRNYQNAINFRLGGEIAVDVFRFRGGLVLSGTPYAGVNSTNTTYSIGTGVRLERFFVDLALRLQNNENTFEPYTVSEIYPQNSVNVKSNKGEALLTFGFNF